MEDKNRFSILLEHLLEVAEVKNYTLAKRLQYDVSYISNGSAAACCLPKRLKSA